MKAGDLVRYRLYIITGVFEEDGDVFGTGLLVEFNKVQRTCVILDDKSGELIKKHCSDVQLVKVGHESR